MNKIVYLAIGGIWAVMLAIVGFGIWAAPDIDVLMTLQKYKIVGQEYLDRKPIEPSEIPQDVPDDKFVLLYADYMQAFQQAENEYNSVHQLLKVAIKPQSLKGTGQLSGAYNRLKDLNAQTSASYEKLATAQQKAIATLESLDPEGMEVFGESIADAIESIEKDEITFRDDITKTRLALEKYYKAILDFLAQKNGEYSIDGSAVFFSTAQDQQYFDQLRRGRKEYERKLQESFEKYQHDLRAFNAKIPVDIKQI